MPDFDADAGRMMALPAMRQQKGRPFVAWLVIALAVLLIVLLHSQPAWLRNLTRAHEVTVDGHAGELFSEMQARILVGAAAFTGVSKSQMYEQAPTLNAGPVEQRMRFVVLAGELAGPEEALAQLTDLQDRLAKSVIVPTATQQRLMDTLSRIYRDYERGRFDAPSVSSEDRSRLQGELGWFGQLALAPAEGPDQAARAEVMRPAYRTLWVTVALVTLAGLLGLAGFAALTVFVIFLVQGKLQRGIYTGSHHGSVYAETFALWMVLFLSLNFATGRLASGSGLWVNGIATLLSLVALIWPVLRGVPWWQVRWEVGLKAGKQPALEPAIGLVGYAMAIPLFAVGFLMTALLLRIQTGLQGPGSPTDDFSPTPLPSHPVIPYVTSGNTWDRIQVLLLATVIAPLAEETMFRGVLYRHLREASARLGAAWSIFCSATVTSFIFAVIHPQGLVTIPALMSLAYALTLLREWRGTLIPGIITHGFHNGLLLLFSMLALGN